MVCEVAENRGGGSAWIGLSIWFLERVLGAILCIKKKRKEKFTIAHMRTHHTTCHSFVVGVPSA